MSRRGCRLALAGLLGIGLATSHPAHAANFNVGTEAQLRTAISNAQNGDTITFTANITLSANLPQVQRYVAINGGNFTLSSNNQYRGLYVQSGTVAINNLRIVNTLAQGGNGVDGGAPSASPAISWLGQFADRSHDNTVWRL